MIRSIQSSRNTTLTRFAACVCQCVLSRLSAEMYAVYVRGKAGRERGARRVNWAPPPPPSYISFVLRRPSTGRSSLAASRALTQHFSLPFLLLLPSPSGWLPHGATPLLLRGALITAIRCCCCFCAATFFLPPPLCVAVLRTIIESCLHPQQRQLQPHHVHHSVWTTS
jgi:hypothetical protein